MNWLWEWKPFEWMEKNGPYRPGHIAILWKASLMTIRVKINSVIDLLFTPFPTTKEPVHRLYIQVRLLTAQIEVPSLVEKVHVLNQLHASQ